MAGRTVARAPPLFDPEPAPMIDLRALRARLNLSQAKFAERYGIGVATFTGIACRYGQREM